MTVCFTERVGETPPLPRHSPKQACSNGIVGQVSDVGQRRSCMGAHARVRRSPNLTTQRVAHDLNLCARFCALRVYIYIYPRRPRLSVLVWRAAMLANLPLILLCFLILRIVCACTCVCVHKQLTRALSLCYLLHASVSRCLASTIWHERRNRAFLCYSLELDLAFYLISSLRQLYFLLRCWFHFV